MSDNRFNIAFGNLMVNENIFPTSLPIDADAQLSQSPANYSKVFIYDIYHLSWDRLKDLEQKDNESNNEESFSDDLNDMEHLSDGESENADAWDFEDLEIDLSEEDEELLRSVKLDVITDECLERVRQCFQHVNSLSDESKNQKYANIVFCDDQFLRGSSPLPIFKLWSQIPPENLYSTARRTREEMLKEVQNRFGKQCQLLVISSNADTLVAANKLSIPAWPIYHDDDLVSWYNQQRYVWLPTEEQAAAQSQIQALGQAQARVVAQALPLVRAQELANAFARGQALAESVAFARSLDQARTEAQARSHAEAEAFARGQALGRAQAQPDSQHYLQQLWQQSMAQQQALIQAHSEFLRQLNQQQQQSANLLEQLQNLAPPGAQFPF